MRQIEIWVLGRLCVAKVERESAEYIDGYLYQEAFSYIAELTDKATGLPLDLIAQGAFGGDAEPLESLAYEPFWQVLDEQLPLYDVENHLKRNWWLTDDLYNFNHSLSELI